jgi:hypothetical protein
MYFKRLTGWRNTLVSNFSRKSSQHHNKLLLSVAFNISLPRANYSGVLAFPFPPLCTHWSVPRSWRMLLTWMPSLKTAAAYVWLKSLLLPSSVSMSSGPWQVIYNSKLTPFLICVWGHNGDGIDPVAPGGWAEVPDMIAVVQNAREKWSCWGVDVLVFDLVCCELELSKYSFNRILNNFLKALWTLTILSIFI